MTLLERIVRATGISSADIKSVEQHPLRMSYIVVRWNRRRHVIDARELHGGRA